MKRMFSALLFTVFFASTAQAGSLRINWSCSDILNYVYNNDRLAIGNDVVSLRSCSGPTLAILDQSNQKCVNVNVCELTPAPQPPRSDDRGNHHHHSGESIGGYYSDGTYDGRAHHYESDRYNNSNNGGA